MGTPKPLVEARGKKRGTAKYKQHTHSFFLLGTHTHTLTAGSQTIKGMEDRHICIHIKVRLLEKRKEGAGEGGEMERKGAREREGGSD